MSYGDSPASNPVDAVRLLVGDTKSPEQLTDNELAYLLSEERGNTLRAAARAAETLASKYANQAEERVVGPLRLANRNQSQTVRYQRLAKTLWARAFSRGVAPYAGGTSIADKTAKGTDADRVEPFFKRDLMKYPAVNLGQSGNEKVNI